MNEYDIASDISLIEASGGRRFPTILMRFTGTVIEVSKRLSKRGVFIGATNAQSTVRSICFRLVLSLFRHGNDDDVRVVVLGAERALGRSTP